MTRHIVLPAFNEEESLPNLLNRFAALPIQERQQIQIYVINDGSRDGTKRVAEEYTSRLPLMVVDHPRNMGLGQAVQTGIHTAIQHADVGDLMVIMDADDTHDPKLVAQLAAAIENGADIAIASRFVRGGDDSTAPFLRRLLSRGAAICFKAVLPIDKRVNDFTSGFRAYRIALLKRAISHYGERLIEEKGFACMVELLLKLRFCKPQIVEVPFQLEYDRKLGTSKIRILRTILQYLKLAIRDRMSPPPYREI